MIESVIRMAFSFARHYHVSREPRNHVAALRATHIHD
jgi:hypothetical protein